MIEESPKIVSVDDHVVEPDEIGRIMMSAIATAQPLTGKGVKEA
jgi:hypothetical protein